VTSGGARAGARGGGAVGVLGTPGSPRAASGLCGGGSRRAGAREGGAVGVLGTPGSPRAASGLCGGGSRWKSGADAARSGARKLEEDSRCSGDHFAGVVGVRGEVGRRAHGGAEERRHGGARRVARVGGAGG
jgi:hypothetical protein